MPNLARSAARPPHRLPRETICTRLAASALGAVTRHSDEEAAVSEYEVSRRAMTAADPEAVIALVEDFRAWPSWSPWEGIDPDLERVYSGADRGPGAAYAWSGNRKAGAGRMEITDQAADRVEVALEFSRPMRSRAAVTFHVTRQGGGAEIVWRMTGPRTVATRALGVIGGMDRLMGPDLERGLAQLARAAEQGATAQDAP